MAKDGFFHDQYLPKISEKEKVILKILYEAGTKVLSGGGNDDFLLTMQKHYHSMNDEKNNKNRRARAWQIYERIKLAKQSHAMTIKGIIERIPLGNVYDKKPTKASLYKMLNNMAEKKFIFREIIDKKVYYFYILGNVVAHLNNIQRILDGR